MNGCVNANDRCIVILTKHGADILNGVPGCFAYWKKQWSDGDEFVTQIWELMRLFGPYMGMGCKTPFEKNTIRIEQ